MLRVWLPKMIGISWGMAMSSPSDDTTFTVVDAVGMWRKRNRSRARPKSGATTNTAITNDSHCGHLGP